MENKSEPMLLYASPTPNVFKVLIAFEEADISYNVRPVNIWQGEQFEDWFKQINPNSKVPVIVDPDGPTGSRHVVFESCAILLYLAEKTGIGLPGEPLARSNVLQWLIFQAANLGPMCGQLNHFTLFAPADQNYGRSRYDTEVRRLYDVMEDRLAGCRHFGGDEFSIADMAIFPWLANLKSRHGETLRFPSLQSAEHPRLREWYLRCAARPAVERAQAAFSAIPSTLAHASEDERDRVFGRNAYARSS